MDLYIFGAGASAAEGAPATQEFFARAWELLGPDFDSRVRAVWSFIETVFQAPLRGARDFAHVPAVDDVISLVDWSLHVNQGLGRDYPPPRLYDLRRHLEYLLCATLEAALANRPTGGAHARFAQALAERTPESYALVSLNYDTLLDRALAAAGLQPDYGLGALCASPAGGTPLAKLHGSLNWALCHACSHIAVNQEHCSNCGNDRLQGLVISPTVLKSYEGAHLQQVWDLALACLQRATRICFVGYSMPAADVAVYHLIRRGLLTNKHDLPVRVEVINHTNPAWSAAERAHHEAGVRARFTHLFGPGACFDFSGFHGQV